MLNDVWVMDEERTPETTRQARYCVRKKVKDNGRYKDSGGVSIAKEQRDPRDFGSHQSHAHRLVSTNIDDGAFILHSRVQDSLFPRLSLYSHPHKSFKTVTMSSKDSRDLIKRGSKKPSPRKLPRHPRHHDVRS